MRKLLIAALVVVVLLVAADRITVHIAQGKVADRVQSAEQLANRPEITIHGFPFLTQAVSGRYDDVEARVVGLRRGVLRIAAVDVHLHGVELPLSDALGGTVHQLPVREAQAQVLLTYEDINAAVADRGITVAPAAGALRVTGTLDILGHRASVSADGRMSVVGDTVRVHASNFHSSVFAADVLAQAVGRQLDFSLSAPHLPFALTLRNVNVTDAGVVVTATAEHLVLRS